ncbi:mitochondrial uncoupling protein 1-like [Magnolia sinica]|uniref:mitochondrial uncoupling protein 1-like n=1 Tax=Magnolia sinica TaxID=86752 RepID=UPI0026594F2E|nr:mitochondrial uncoupling protein 1-like [Magnolia sinica]
MSDLKPKTEILFAGTFASSAFTACVAEICTIPLDTAKVRLQLQKKATSGDGLTPPKCRGMLGTVATIAREEGLSALWKGIVPGLHRQCLFGGLRIGLYEPVKSFYVGSDFVGDVPLTKKILAALTTGALAITIANPTDLVKVRLQYSEGKLQDGVPRRYSEALNAYSTIIKQEGFKALWTGLGPNIARNAIINAAELASYDQVKQTILKIPGFSDNVFTHLLASLGACFVAVCIGSPVDVMKSRKMGDSTYKNTLDCFIKTLKNDGPFAFYKGFIPNFGRLGSWDLIMFLTLEQAKKFFTREVPS